MSVLPDLAARTAALTAIDRSLLVEAGAGSGKTSVMAGRVAVLFANGVELNSLCRSVVNGSPGSVWLAARCKLGAVQVLRLAPSHIGNNAFGRRVTVTPKCLQRLWYL
jgi:hypothetical protein